MLWQGVFGLWRWLRGGRSSHVAYNMMVLDAVLPGAAAEPLPTIAETVLAAPIDIGLPVALARRDASPFWTAAGVRGILAARRPCLVASGIDTDKVADVTPAEPPAPVRLVDVPTRTEPVTMSPVQAIKPTPSHPAMADRLRQVREANRPVRNVPGLKRQARDVLAKAHAPAILGRAKLAAPQTPAPDDAPSLNVRHRPVLVYAA